MKNITEAAVVSYLKRKASVSKKHKFSFEHVVVMPKMIDISLANIYPVEFPKLTRPPSSFGAVHYQFWENQDNNLKLNRQTVWSLVKNTRMCRLTWLYSGGKDLGHSRIRINIKHH